MQTAAPQPNGATLGEIRGLEENRSTKIQIFIKVHRISSLTSHKDVCLFIPQHSLLAFSLTTFLGVYFITKENKNLFAWLLYYLIISCFYVCVSETLLQIT